MTLRCLRPAIRSFTHLGTPSLRILQHSPQCVGTRLAYSLKRANAARRFSAPPMKTSLSLPDKVHIGLDEAVPKDVVGNDLDTNRPPAEVRQKIGDEYSAEHLLRWSQPPRTVLIVKKPNDERTRAAFLEIVRWLRSEYPYMNIVVEPAVAEELGEEVSGLHVISKDNMVEYSRTIDFAITLGGDGTILHASSLFPRAVPPIISFSLGTLGFLLPFGFQDYQTALIKVIEGSVPLLLRMRLTCAIFRNDGRRVMYDGLDQDLQAMNDITLHRGHNPHLTVIDCSVGGEFLTDAVADGLIVSTPTGSTAYSLSAGGPIVHPAVQSLLLTPICPRSLSFRPALLPPYLTVRLRLSKNSRGTAQVSVDGRDVYLLGKEEYVEVRMSQFPIPCVSRTRHGKDWVRDINQTLKWNQSFTNRHGDGDSEPW
ncbi:uncharacterized protein SPPG_05314 [Spizellomyces punctatus DAOM BR117]|uniref:NAD+ kinase n=1 Tax=Spizellomyces punctatus (strain DAOM BR117) TaxID=645134 RepID=A0A0L0HFY6_SPIPD|nr:uncharacterized protein SPPG_05314 [Spizellomyces punctatus DAOM BR117]KNC99941.1 hypothetical protein SPPG_05314 [Spizellomyces punctatus DAOM BR117]|eukprot:XP_016607981.1 hypothetical protein SPPG_05314 [Spizellomyces punctatus DAOM BR117]